MTKAYFVGNINITDPEGYAEYQKHVPQTISDFGGYSPSKKQLNRNPAFG